MFYFSTIIYPAGADVNWILKGLAQVVEKE
jgi:hypothetical protein